MYFWLNEQSDSVCTCQCHLDLNKNPIFIELCTISLIISTGDERRAASASSDEVFLSVSSSLNSTEKRNYPRLFKFLRPSLFPVKCDQVCSNNCLEHTITIKALIAHFHSNRMVNFVLQFKLRQDLDLYEGCSYNARCDLSWYLMILELDIGHFEIFWNMIWPGKMSRLSGSW